MLIFTKLMLSATLAASPVGRQVSDSATVLPPAMERVGEPVSMTLIALGLLGMTVSDRRRRRRESASKASWWVKYL
jgi:hypothetical protein